EFRFINKEILLKKSVQIDETSSYLSALKKDSSCFEHISPEQSISGFSRSFGTIPFYIKGKQSGLYFEYADYRVFSQREIELYFFIAKTLSEGGGDH
ncbi:MAG: hypothetical protein ACOCUT_03035, partial [bacterium]